MFHLKNYSLRYMTGLSSPLELNSRMVGGERC